MVDFLVFVRKLPSLEGRGSFCLPNITAQHPAMQPEFRHSLSNRSPEWKMDPWQQEERVLCFERKLLDELGVFQGLSLEFEKIPPVLTSSTRLGVSEPERGELDKRYKQLIPYGLIICNGRILRYRRGRGGQETRSARPFLCRHRVGTFQTRITGLFSSAAGYQEE